MAIKIRTISNLEQLDSDNISGTEKFEVSHEEDSKYVSKSVTLDQINERIKSSTVDEMINRFDMQDGQKKDITLTELQNYQITTRTKSVIFDGQKTFSEYPLVIGNSSGDSNAVTTRKDVSQIISDSTIYIGANSSIDANPQNDVDDSNNGTKSVDGCMVWRIDHNGTDSTKFKIEGTNQEANPDGITCTESGNLTIYGWLADNGGVAAHQAWVGLYGNIGTTNGNRWVLLQIQPWIIGSRSSSLQYVGFNLPVKKGLRLKIKTGFNVNGDNTATNEKNSLVAEQLQHNTFIGYIVKA